MQTSVYFFDGLEQDSIKRFLRNLADVVMNWKHWPRVQNLHPCRSSFERATTVCVLGYMASSSAALSNFTTILLCVKKLTSWCHPSWILLLKCQHTFYYSRITLFLDACYSQNYSGKMFTGLAGTYPHVVALIWLLLESSIVIKREI